MTVIKDQWQSQTIWTFVESRLIWNVEVRHTWMKISNAYLLHSKRQMT